MSPVIKRGGDKFTIPGKYLLFILTIVAVALMVITLTTSLFSGIANTIAGFVVVPFQRGITTAGTWLISEADKLETIERLQSENDELQARVDQLTEENMQLTQDKYELNTLRQLYELDAQYESYEKVGAHVIAKDSGNWFYSFIIDKGLDDGLAIDMNIIAGGGLVGRITSIGPDWAKVTTIIADNFSVSGMVLSTSDNLIVTGNLESYEKGVISFSKLQDSADVVVIGDKVVTSNISDKYLPEILIGYITTIESDSNNLTKSGTLTPAVDFEHLDEVLVITTLKQTVEE
ncbi:MULTISPECIES: rod shape-determining protein MreC [Butyrivibrio]|jgi:rod shape-determining protein MreC|uniref:Cell shape-determining protein MreC n=1 Tax=Butyrivibrio fibrisolvens TaxID=831 RepID=A0A1H9U5L3_BUTFI|nr:MULTISPECIES: rod shape-determining protein MreC [Butyrivibrio]MBQ1458030.1 rod shape-determining protein MreC [Butyrivibrio sp.]MCR4634986.1 rod shape-determining protein MreC [Butyrivibrio sp.]SEP55486.1 rod shape-determining protein MreC [Butyrivibrio sp. TB]SES04363.1 rod shape-determining protein MreC [Butyrivibrio fibrisolvens]